MEVVGCYSESDKTKDDSDEDADDKKDGNRKNDNRQDNRNDHHRHDNRHHMRIGDKRKGGGNLELVANTQKGDYKGKKGNGNYPRKKFNPSATLSGPCVLHNRDGRPATHTTNECFQFCEL